MEKYKSRFNTNPQALNIPWIESPFFKDLLPIKLKESKNFYSLEDLRYFANMFNREGYLIVSLDIDDFILENIKADILSKIEQEAVKSQQAHFHYNNSMRVFEAWKFSNCVRELCCNAKVINLLKFLYGREPIPFQTINFIKSSEQPLHNDEIHFNVIPPKWLTGVWFALEDVGIENGTLEIVPKSHKLPYFDFQSLNLSIPEYGQEADNYKIYEEFISALVETSGLCRVPITCKKGDAVIWSSALLHGGYPAKNKDLTRWSQAVHYYYEGCQKYYCPMFSDVVEGQYALKDLNQKDIRKFHLQTV